MKGRLVIREGDVAREEADTVVSAEAAAAARERIAPADLLPAGPVDEARLRAAIRRALALAGERGSRTIALPALGAGAGLPLQRCAEILLEEARAHLAGGTPPEEIRFVVSGEPALRVFESVQDAFRIAEQAKRWST